MGFLEKMGDFIWNPWLLGLFLLVGGYYSVRTGFFQLFGMKIWWKNTVGTLFQKRSKKASGGLSQFQALSTALASTIGTGSIAGVATAIFYGGPGAVFWMWVSAFLGLMTGFAEKTLAVRYRERAPGGGWQGGPMTYIAKGLHLNWLAGCFALCCIFASLGGGNMVQANSIATALEATFGWNKLLVGLLVALVTGLVIFGGVGRIGRVSEKLVPAMALLFIGGGVLVLCANASALLPALDRILRCAFAPNAALGGGLGYGVSAAMRYGIARGVFTNEAGLGSSAMAHAAAEVEEPALEGMWGIFEVFIATLVVCTITALAILTTGVYSELGALTAIESGIASAQLQGAPLSAAAFSAVLGHWGSVFVAVCLMLFAFTSLLGWSYYGERGLSHLLKTERFTVLYRLIFVGVIVAGSVGDVTAVWQLADVLNGLMALPNLLALLLLSPEVLRLLKGFLEKEKRSAA